MIYTFYIRFVNSSIIPENNPSIYNTETINMFSLMSLLLLNSIIKAVPQLVKSPAVKAAKVMELFRYNSVNMTLAPQFGISPIRHVMNEPSMVFFSNIFDKKSSPI